MPAAVSAAEAMTLGGNLPLFSEAYMIRAVPNCFWLLAHWTLRACSRAALRAGRRMEMRRAIMPMTTRSSTKVKPYNDLGRGVCDIGFLQSGAGGTCLII